MCGLAGWVGQVPNGEDHISCIVDVLRHRGPDGHGMRVWPDASLIHTRLSIIDLSSAGAQPLANEDGTVWTVFNGEIYNHREIRRWLESRGHVLRGRSDSEILPHLYEEEGPELVHRLRGMFALAIYDTVRRELLLARDRFGIKPLFYAQGREFLAFASTINAILQIPVVDDRPDPQSIADFAALLYIPAPQTFYAGIRALQPGETLQARHDSGGVSIRTRVYHRWAVVPDPAMSLTFAERRAAVLLDGAVRRQLESDVPLGALLSGGIDSSLVSGAAQSALADRLHTFNVRFSDQAYDESWAARAVATQIGSDHVTLDMGDIQGSWQTINAALLDTGQPFADTSLFAVNAISRVMKQHVTVALSGDGGDEAFGGYALYRRIVGISRWQGLPTAFQLWGARTLKRFEPHGLVPARLPRRVAELSVVDDTSILETLLSWVRQDEHAELCRDLGALPVRRLFEPQWQYGEGASRSRLERLSAHATEVYTRLVLPNDYLFKVDTGSMAHALEVRVPMLDEELFRFALSVPHRLKASWRTNKRVLRAVAKRRMPSSIVSKPKQGFSIPVDLWVEPEFKERLREMLLGPSSRLRDVFRPGAYHPVLEAFSSGQSCRGISRQGLYQRAIMLLSVHLHLTRERSHPMRRNDATARCHQHVSDGREAYRWDLRATAG